MNNENNENNEKKGASLWATQLDGAEVKWVGDYDSLSPAEIRAVLRKNKDYVSTPEGFIDSSIGLRTPIGIIAPLDATIDEIEAFVAADCPVETDFADAESGYYDAREWILGQRENIL
jgi:hypothetical protein